MKCTVTFKDSYRPVIKGFVQYQHSSVQLVQKKEMDRNAKLRGTSVAIKIHQQRSPHSYHVKNRLKDSVQFRKHPV